ncbi:MAG: YceI family protein [Minwuiales bacterium]|nr:YceI family protein [Minwuiales bacterium]
MKTKSIAAMAAATLLFGTAWQAQAAETFEIDQSHTNIVFLVDHLGYSNMVGEFHEFSGSFTFDPDDVTNNKVEMVIKTDSVDTDHEKRDDHLRSPDFFNTAEFPEMTFTSTSVEQTGKTTGKITGDLTLLGVTKPVTLDVTFNKMAPHPIPSYNGVVVAGFSARAKVDRTDFGMQYAAGAIGNELDLIIEVEGHKK